MVIDIEPLTELEKQVYTATLACNQTYYSKLLQRQAHIMLKNVIAGTVVKIYNKVYIVVGKEYLNSSIDMEIFDCQSGDFSYQCPIIPIDSFLFPSESLEYFIKFRDKLIEEGCYYPQFGWVKEWRTKVEGQLWDLTFVDGQEVEASLVDDRFVFSKKVKQYGR